MTTEHYALANLMLNGETLRLLTDKKIITNKEALLVIEKTQSRMVGATDTIDLGVQHHLDNLKAIFS